ncbi:MAG: dipeptidase [Candidatus Gastranaerophilales bacterium]|nr:dipeptidase [Candidatus Gastranaerophilales bacterium]
MAVVDMHCDTILELWNKIAGNPVGSRYVVSCGESLRRNCLQVDLVRMKQSGYLLQNFALFVDTGACVDPWQKVCELYELYQRELAQNEDLIAPVSCFADIAANRAAGKMSALLTVEEGAVCQGEVEKLRELYRMGVRMLTLTWNYPNELGYPNLDMCEIHKMQERNVEQEVFAEAFRRGNVRDGLTEKGIAFLGEMEDMGMIVDVSHLSDAGFYHVFEHTRKPFVASHSNARGVCPNARNLTDDMLKKLGERGGVTGLNFCKDFLREPSSGQPNRGEIEDVVRHARYITDVGGMDILGLGSDFDGIETNEALPGAESMELLWQALKKNGYTERELDKIFEENVLRVYREVLA